MASNNSGYGKQDDAARRRADAMQKKASKKRYDDDEYDEDEARKRAGKGCLIAFLVVLVILAGLLLTGFLYLRGEVNGNNATATESTVEVVVPPGSGGSAVAAVLKEAGMIGNEAIFRFYVRFNGAGSGFQTGTYELRPGMSYDELIEALSQPPPPPETTQVMIPKGSTVVQFGEKLAEAGLCTVDDFVKEANNLENYSDIPFISKLLEEGFDENTYMRAEGYLTPQTYDFYVDADVSYYVRKLYEQTEVELSKLVGPAEGQDIYEYLEEKGLSVHDLFTLASMVEEEASEIDENQARVAGVYWNRLTKDLPAGASGRRMECDATYLYIRDWIARDYGGDVNNVPAGLITGYDTYEREGLPAGPISSPGPTALQAALTPEMNDWFYYFVDPTGEYHYNKTFSAHQADINRYGVKGMEEE